MTTAKPATAAAPGAHQSRPKRRIPSTSSAPPPAAKTPPIAVDLATSTAQPSQPCVIRPTSLARWRAAARSGNAAVVVTSVSATAAAAPVRTGRLPARGA